MAWQGYPGYDDNRQGYLDPYTQAQDKYGTGGGLAPSQAVRPMTQDRTSLQNAYKGAVQESYLQGFAPPPSAQQANYNLYDPYGLPPKQEPGYGTQPIYKSGIGDKGGAQSPYPSPEERAVVGRPANANYHLAGGTRNWGGTSTPSYGEVTARDDPEHFGNLPGKEWDPVQDPNMYRVGEYNPVTGERRMSADMYQLDEAAFNPLTSHDPTRQSYANAGAMSDYYKGVGTGNHRVDPNLGGVTEYWQDRGAAMQDRSLQGTAAQMGDVERAAAATGTAAGQYSVRTPGAYNLQDRGAGDIGAASGMVTDPYASGLQRSQAGYLQDVQAGRAPSVAAAQLALGQQQANVQAQRATERTIAEQSSQAASAYGGNIALARRTAQNNTGRALGDQAIQNRQSAEQFNLQQGLLRAQEQTAATGQLNELGGAMRAGDAQAAGVLQAGAGQTRNFDLNDAQRRDEMARFGAGEVNKSAADFVGRKDAITLADMGYGTQTSITNAAAANRADEFNATADNQLTAQNKELASSAAAQSFTQEAMLRDKTYQYYLTNIQDEFARTQFNANMALSYDKIRDVLGQMDFQSQQEYELTFNDMWQRELDRQHEVATQGRQQAFQAAGAGISAVGAVAGTIIGGPVGGAAGAVPGQVVAAQGSK